MRTLNNEGKKGGNLHFESGFRQFLISGIAFVLLLIGVRLAVLIDQWLSVEKTTDLCKASGVASFLGE
ncbi:MAG: hypothetical protein AB9917_05420 [Negativicutes bacterium]